MLESRIATERDLKPFGMGCTYCHRQFEIGDEYVSALTGMIGDTPCTTIVCPECAQKLDTLVECPDCNGLGEFQGARCEVCKGAGEVFVDTTEKDIEE